MLPVVLLLALMECYTDKVVQESGFVAGTPRHWVTANLRRGCLVHLCGSKLAAWNAAHFVCLVLKING